MAIVRDKVYVDIVTETKKAAANLVTYAAAVAAAGVAVKLAVDFVKSSVAAFVVQEQAVARLEAALKATGGAVGITSYEMQKMAASLDSLTKFSDEAIIKAQGLLVTFTNIGEEVFPRALEAALDLSEMFGTDLKAASIQLGKALNDPIKGMSALAETGITFSQTQKDLIRGFQEQGDIVSAQKVILAELEREFGGVARAARDTASGALPALQNALSDLQASAGADFATGARPLIEWLTKVIQKSADTSTALRGAAASAKELATVGASTKPTEQLKKESDVLRENLDIRNKTGNISRQEYAEKKLLLRQLELELAKRTELDSWLMKGTRDAQIKAEADLKAAQAALDEAEKNEAALGRLNEEWEKTPEGIAAADAALIAYFESFKKFSDPSLQKMLDAVLANLRKQKDATKDVADAVTHRLTPAWELYGEVSLDVLEKVKAAQKEAEDAWKDAANQRLSDAEQVGGQIIDIWSGVNAARMQGFENEKHAAITAIEAEIEAAEAAGKNTEALVASKIAMEEDFAARKKKLLREEAIANKAAALFDIAINTASAVVEALPRLGLAVIIGAMGAVQAAVVAASPIPSFKTGGDFVTSGEQLIRVGDNPSGRERVRIDPDPSSSGGDDMMLHAVFNLDGKAIADFVTKASRDRRILTSAGSIV